MVKGGGGQKLAFFLVSSHVQLCDTWVLPRMFFIKIMLFIKIYWQHTIINANIIV